MRIACQSTTAYKLSKLPTSTKDAQELLEVTLHAKDGPPFRPHGIQITISNRIQLLKNTLRMTTGPDMSPLQYANTGVTLIVTDSRGHSPSSDLKENIIAQGLHLDNIEVAVFGGASLLYAYNLVKPLIEEVNPDLLIIAAGICTITQRIKKRTSLRFKTVEAATRHYLADMNKIVTHAKRDYPDVKLVFAPLTGVNLCAYNELSERHPQQDLLNTTIIAINDSISQFNREINAVTPRTASLFHRKRECGSYTHRYYHLSDGYHLSPTASEYWAKQLARAIDKNMAPSDQTSTPPNEVNKPTKEGEYNPSSCQTNQG